MKDNDRMRIVFYVLIIELGLLFEFAALERLSRPNPRNYASTDDYFRGMETHPVAAIVITFYTGVAAILCLIIWEPAISKILAGIGSAIFRGVFFRRVSERDGKGRIPGMDPFAESKPPFEP